MIYKKPFKYVESLAKVMFLDIKEELKLVEHKNKSSRRENWQKKPKQLSMKELGIKRFEIL